MNEVHSVTVGTIPMATARIITVREHEIIC